MKTIREISIQITLSGFSFSVSQNKKHLFGSSAKSYDFDAIITDPGLYTSAYIGWNVDSVLLIPQEIFREERAGQYLAAANLLQSKNEVVWNSDLNENIVSVWAAESRIKSSIDSLFPNAYHYHNLQHVVDIVQCDSVVVQIIEDMAHVGIWNRNGLVAAESIRFVNVEDLLYFVLKLNQVDKFGRNKLSVVADVIEPYEELFGRNFPDAQFVQNPDIYHQKMLKCE